MPGLPPKPATRSLLHRKVHMRLAALGMGAAHVSGLLFADADPKNRSAFFNRLLKHPHRCDVVRRLHLERLLTLPVGTLLDQVPIAVVGCVPVPVECLPEPGREGPGAGDDEMPDGCALQVATRSIDAVVVVLGGVTPESTPPEVLAGLK